MISWQSTWRKAWLRFFLAAVAVVLGVLLSATTASAATPTTAQTCVGVITITTPVVVGFDTSVWASQHQVHGPPQAQIVVATGVAAKTAEKVAVNGETAATKLGREMHAAWDYGPGFEKGFRLPSGKRVDGINFDTRQVVELKPNNPRQLRLGQQQVDGYVNELNQVYPGDTPWTGSVVTYGSP